MDEEVPKSAAAAEPEKQARSHAVRRDEAEGRLLKAAARLVAERGLDGLTLAEVGEAAGYSRGLPRHYFGKKNDLIAALAGFIVDSFAQNLAKASPREPGMESLLFAAESYFDGAGQGSRALLVAIIESLREPALQPAMSAVTDRSVRRIASNIRQGIKLGNIRSDIDVQAQAQLVLATLRMAVMQWLIDPDSMEIGALRDAFTANLRRALAPPA
ncbi:TetR/AcrR family transcriptional regulator [Afipia sp. P52-10]|uniref:TetR/AcrR family transcriptional regulator n=1 Tax=Afipia sp. P52-10 TaxID=1429916 RepID=UPI0013625948|nr:TetR/AcrR family transcriptional regulator [Afipia sp. P52-10]